MSITRKDLRRMVLAMVGDINVLTATANGTTTTFVDAANLVGDSGRYAGRYALFTSGANAGQVRYVSGYNGSTHTLTFQSALPNSTATGNELELTNAYGIGVTFEMVHNAINWAIRAARAVARVPDVFEPTDAFDGEGDRTVDLPDDWVMVESVHYQHDDTEAWHNVRKADKLNQNGWAIDRANRTLTITGDWARIAHDRQLRLYGYALPGELNEDSDTTDLDVEWLTYRAASHLLLDVVRSRAGADWSGPALHYKGEADRLQPRLTPNLKPSAQAI